MNQYFLYRGKTALGPCFNEAASILAETPNAQILEQDNNIICSTFLIHASPSTITEIKQRLRGWAILQNGRSAAA